MFDYHMPSKYLGISLFKDSRGVSEVIGFLLVFSLVIILISVNQAQFIPQENSEIEFQHYQDVQNDMIEVRSSISTAGQANVSQYPTVELGTSYPSRLFALNPPAPAGTLETSKKYDITLENTSNSATVETQFLVYRPRYNELDENPIWYENSVLYIDARDDNAGVAVLEDQNLHRGGSQVRINAIQNNFSATSTGEVTVEIYPTENTNVNIDEWTGDVNIQFPTRLNESEYWDNELGEHENNAVTYHGVVSHPDEGIHLVNLTVEANSLKFNTVGIDSAPESQDSARRGIGVGENTDSDGGSGGDGNDGSTGDPLEYRSLIKGDSGVVQFEIENTIADPITVSSFSVDATRLDNSPRIENSDSDEVRVSPDSGQEGSANNKNKYKADDTSYDFDQNAIIDSGSTADVNIRFLEKANGDSLDYTLERVDSEANADVIVTLKTVNSGNQVFYFSDVS